MALYGGECVGRRNGRALGMGRDVKSGLSFKQFRIMMFIVSRNSVKSSERQVWQRERERVGIV